jgi:anti-anti-sigma factor
MEFDETLHGAVLVLSPKGRLDSISAPDFEQMVRARLAAGHRRLVIDLGALDYVSSAGLRVLLIAAKILKAERGQIALCRLADSVLEIFRISGFDRIFTILPTIEASVGRIATES